MRKKVVSLAIFWDDSGVYDDEMDGYIERELVQRSSRNELGEIQFTNMGDFGQQWIRNLDQT